MSDGRTVRAVSRICKVVSLMRAAHPAPRSVKELQADLDWIYNLQLVHSTVWRDLMEMEKHELIERVKRPGQIGWAFKLKGISDDHRNQDLYRLRDDR